MRKCQTHICHAPYSWVTEDDQQNEPDDVKNAETTRSINSILKLNTETPFYGCLSINDIL